MSHEYLTNIPLAEALATYIAVLWDEGVKLSVETVGLAEACGRVTARAVYAEACSPHYNACAMDGIALCAEKTYGATETTPVTLLPGDFTRVDTGDPLPDDCDSVIMVEEIIETNSPPGSVTLHEAAVPWQHIRQIGEDVSKGDMLLPSFAEITPSAAGALAAGGVASVETLKVSVGIIPTGDEIVPPSAKLAPGEIAEFNSLIFTGMLEKWGATVKTYPIVKDEPALLEAALEKAAAECEIVLINAGSSAGSEDFSASAIAKLGKVVHHGIAIRPGKPAILGIIGRRPVIGVPGYPVSGIVVLEEIVRPVIDWLLRRLPSEPETVMATLSRRVNSPLKYREFVRASLGKVNGRLVAVPLSRGAGVVTSFVRADGLIDIPQNSEGFEAGEKISVRLLRPLREIEKTLVITGSHDPLIDEAADLLRRTSGTPVASSHVGSMGGVMAVKRGEAHMAGVHLLDADTGVYNLPFIGERFPNGGAVLHPCVKRSQGFIVAKGNPFGVQSWEDIAAKKLRYLNRQGGSGTRVLCDYLLKLANISSLAINGYEREEYTHTNVAAIIASGSADAGLGIYSAAKMYGLDFVPICDERYEFLIAEQALETESIRRFLEILKTEEFAARLEKMGGYLLEIGTE